MRPKDPKKIESIYEATLKTYERYGLSGITIKRISAISNLSTGAIYTYFKTKNDILEALFIRIGSIRKETFPFHFSNSQTFEEKFDIFWNTIYDFETEHFLETNLAHDFFYSGNCSEEIRKEFLTANPAIELLQEGIDKGILKNIHPLLFGKFIVSTVRILVKQNQYEPSFGSVPSKELQKSLVWDAIKN